MASHVHKPGSQGSQCFDGRDADADADAVAVVYIRENTVTNMRQLL